MKKSKVTKFDLLIGHFCGTISVDFTTAVSRGQKR